MVKPDVSRRSFLHGVAATGLASSIAQGEASDDPGIVAISSANGLRATEKAAALVKQGWDPLDAAIEGVTIVEEDPRDITVGYGGVPNEHGVVELDASVMHGPTHRAGSVASLRNIKTPARVAKMVMENTDHELLVGDGALQFAKSFGFPEEDLLTDRARKIWLQWRARRGAEDDWLEPKKKPDPVAQYLMDQRKHGTIHCGVRNANGDLCGVTSTSGLFFKIPGRVGDSPIIGAGLYVDNEVGSCGSTGRGEANLLNLSSFQVVEAMRRGLSPKEACLETLQRIVKKTEPRLLDAPGRPSYDLRFYAINKAGEYAGAGMFSGVKFAVYDKKGNRIEDGVHLLEKNR